MTKEWIATPGYRLAMTEVEVVMTMTGVGGEIR
jgi:hypothetical protein